MKLKRFAESLILQSLEDLWDEKHMYRSVDFFVSEDFHLIATMADMDIADRIKILKMVNNVLKGKKKKSTHNEPKQAGRVRKKPPLIPCLPPHIATSM